MPLTLAIIGDCIAAAPHGLGGQFQGARIDGTAGALSATIIVKARPGYEATVISSGSNDVLWPMTRAHVRVAVDRLTANLHATRRRLTGRAIWVVPQQPDAAAAVEAVAAAHGDALVTFKACWDRVHPQSYSSLADDIRTIMETLHR